MINHVEFIKLPNCQMAWHNNNNSIGSTAENLDWFYVQSKSTRILITHSNDHQLSTQPATLQFTNETTH